MKKLNILCVLALIISLVSCSQDEISDNETLLENNTNTELTARRSIRNVRRFCDVSFVNELRFRITLISNNGGTRSFNIPDETVFSDEGFGNVFFTIPRRLRSTNFYRRGIKEYTIESRNGGVTPINLFVGGSINTGIFNQRAITLRAGEAFTYTANVQSGARRNIDNIQLSFNRSNRERTCFLQGIEER